MNRRFTKKAIISLLLSLMMIGMAACGQEQAGGDQQNQAGGNEAKGTITVGGKDFTEQHLLSKITAIYLKEKGYNVEEASNMGSSVVRSALENGQIDLYWEYTGTALVIYQKQAVETDPVKAYEKVKEKDKENKLAWLNKANFNNTYAILMSQDKSDELGIKSISDLAKYVKSDPSALKFASNAEFYAREDGIKGLEKHYGFQFPTENVVKMDSGLLYNALKEKQVDVSVGFATDGRIKGFNLVALEDDKFFFPAYNGAPVVRQEVLDKYPELADLLNQIADKLDTETMMKLNYTVDVEHKDVAEVAREWLTSQQLIK
ncbi:glycine betaine ABC transporter substrate-binding protein [Brevibacillus humidisoli]|uniref:glycine betaine ABC transporter substrate-binding protein n=1 Tax=Brevibacillus humidisoli TaxID=2895522 RepID=UPI001E4C5BCB|nr:glycine betaine ABC transporter substrate-binding protein [Brevibacillus humidisoli]UFJ41739.1 glycine betaine ABC transporter substrate-binding protein [Brevibacillus humidisoli]